ncbi:thioredoxin-domain-containing protein [Trichodelitschia bisporula]|uniref:Thioredoxin-domain-containing protein n=1 Tax=Trichodelitschia bisporula TaxID=703511 RepID=A0A6G1HIR2_9PEZI|nr:thioredoxin-domain-containing protein [Trichodelitschia bisporula]
MSKITPITSSRDLTSLLTTHTTVIVDFYADWCGPCKTIAPIFAQLATSHAQPKVLAFAKVDVDASQDIAQTYSVSAMPTFLVFRNGKVADTIRGANPSALRAAVAKASSSKGAPAPAFASGGRKLGDASGAGSAPVPGAGGAGAGADAMVRFFGLYLTTLFSFDAYAAAEASPFRVGGRR